MSLRTVTIAALLLMTAGEAAASPTSRDPLKAPKGEYVIDKAHASLVARVSHMGFSHYTMRFDRIAGQFAYDPAAWSSTQAVITVDPASVSTGNPDFDRQIAGSQFFDAAKYPQITFVTSAIEAHDDGLGRIDGQLTFHGVTRPVSLDVAFNGVGPGMLGVGVRLGFSGTAHIKRSDFGVTAVSPLVGDDVDLVFEAEFTRK
ncbi:MULTISPECIES: YceI family protein [Phenylobacterium]|uniref:Polyisoprenoid-binding protein YceI n=1 Tax=Phenylobacterium koreense TaxID=266125 RepID=A0ABV2EFG6_9CAUL